MNNEPLPSSPVNKSSTAGEIPSSPTPYEEERLSVLQSFDLLNHEPIPILDILCQYTATHCGVPTAAITLDAVLPQVRCRSGDLQRWQAQAEDEGVPFAEWCRQRLNAGVR